MGIYQSDLCKKSFTGARTLKCMTIYRRMQIGFCEVGEACGPGEGVVGKLPILEGLAQA
jgi:hypothetical protein